MSNPKPQFYLSLANWHRPERFVEAIESFDEIAYDGVELQAGSFDEWLKYPVMEKLNAEKRYDPGHLAAMRRCWGMLKARGKRVGLWMHELWTPGNVMDIYPQLRTARGDIDLSHPLLTEFVRARLERFFDVAPEVDFIVLSLTETPWPVMHRFDNRMGPEECVRWIVGIYNEACRRRGRELVVRPFSANTADYTILRRAMQRFPQAVVMEKSDPFDWDMHLPLNPFLRDYPDHFKAMEFDISAEYFGCNLLPAVALSYLKERFEYGESLGVRRYTARITRYGQNTLTGINRPNALYSAQFFTLTDRDPARFLRRVAPEVYPRASDPDALAGLFERAWHVIERTFYVNGQLMIDAFWGDLRILINNMFFEMVRPNHSLTHARRQWPILGDRPTPSVEGIRREKLDALAEAQELARLVREVAADETRVVEAFDNLVLITDLFSRLAFLGQAYVREIEKTDGSIEPEARATNEVADLMHEQRGPGFYGERVRTGRRGAGGSHGGLPAAVDSLAEEFRAAFAAEHRLRAEVAACEKAEDFILPGFPCEGHLPSKTSHGAGTLIEDGRFARRVTNDTLSYTSAVHPGPKKVAVEVRGFGQTLINGVPALDFEHPAWQRHELNATAANAGLVFTFRRLGSPPPAVRLIVVQALL